MRPKKMAPQGIRHPASGIRHRVSLRIGRGGRLVIPADMLHALGITASVSQRSGPPLAEVEAELLESGEVRIRLIKEGETHSGQKPRRGRPRRR